MDVYQVKHSVQCGTGSGKTGMLAYYQLFQAASELEQAAGFLARFGSGVSSHLLPGLTAGQVPGGSKCQRERVELYRTMLEGTPRNEGETTAPLTTEMISQAVGRQTFNWVALAMRAFVQFQQLIRVFIAMLEAPCTTVAPSASIVRVSDLDRSAESHRSRAPGRTRRPRLVCRELAAM